MFPSEIEDVDGANERESAPAADGLTPDEADHSVRDSRAYSRYEENDADAHAEDVWHHRHDGGSESPQDGPGW